MSNHVEPDKIEAYVGMPRHAHLHWAKLDRDVLFILHSERCLKAHKDLRDCPYSKALDLTVLSDGYWGIWEACMGEPKVPMIDPEGYLVPFPDIP